MNNLKEYQVIVSDFDGTLVGSDFKLSENLIDAINKWQARGGIFTLATGKPFPGIIAHASKKMNLTHPLIVTGGAQIIDPVSSNVLHADYISEEIVKHIINYLSTTELLFEIQTENAVYASNQKLKEMQKHKQYKDLKEFKSDPVLLIRIVTTNTKINVLSSIIQEKLVNKYPQLNIIQSDTTYSQGINITPKDASKHLAVLRLSKMLNIPTDKFIGIGDGLNDYPLLTACGYKVAIETAPAELIAVSDITIPNYEKNGVAEFILQNLI